MRSLAHILAHSAVVGFKLGFGPHGQDCGIGAKIGPALSDLRSGLSDRKSALSYLKLALSNLEGLKSVQLGQPWRSHHAMY